MRNPYLIVELIKNSLILLFYKFWGYKTIVYNLHETYFFDIFSTIYKRLENKQKTVVYFSYRQENKELYNYLITKVDPKKIVSNHISPFLIFDLFICPEITGPDFPINYFPTKKIEIYHGTGTANLYAKKDVLNRFDAHFAIGVKFNEFIEYAYADKKIKPRIFNVGYPKLDVLVSDYNPILPYDLDKNKPTLLYAPHWPEYSSLYKFQEEILSVLAKFDANILIKPHNYLYTKFPVMNWQNRLMEFSKQHKNVTFVLEPNTQELYPISDIMITDTGTTAALEFSLLSKPVIINYDAHWFEINDYTDIETDLCDLGFRFEDLSTLSSIIQNIIAGEYTEEIFTQQKKQKKIIENYLYPVGTATDRAIDAINKLL
jgi:hypothetical protein